jgi:hypothetical protein
LVQEQKGQVVAANIKRSKGKSLVVDAKFNEIPLTAVVDTAAMQTLVNRKYVDNESANPEMVKLNGIAGHIMIGFKLRKQTLHIASISFS